MHVTISGTRATDSKHEDFYYDAFRSFLLPLAMGENKFYIGGARGIDTLALQFLMKAHAAHKATVVVPKRLENQPTHSQGVVMEAIMKYGTQLVELERLDFPTPPSYKHRNEYMLERSNYLLAFPLSDGNKYGGTWGCVSWAYHRGLPYTVLPVPGGLEPYEAIDVRSHA